jgi:hypothetical protein
MASIFTETVISEYPLIAIMNDSRSIIGSLFLNHTCREGSASQPGGFIPSVKTPGTHSVMTGWAPEPVWTS